jgi:hypothetical protein
MLRRLISAAAVLALPVALVFGFYLYAANAAVAVVERHGLEPDADNAVKHAYAAAETYASLRPLLGADAAAATTEWLGKANERAERWVKHSVDWSPEAYKDMRNNLAGIAAARWLYDEYGWTAPATRQAVVGLLSREGILASLDSDPRIPELPLRPDTEAALAAIARDEADLRAAFLREIETRRASVTALISTLRK